MLCEAAMICMRPSRRVCPLCDGGCVTWRAKRGAVLAVSEKPWNALTKVNEIGRLRAIFIGRRHAGQY